MKDTVCPTYHERTALPPSPFPFPPPSQAAAYLFVLIPPSCLPGPFALAHTFGLSFASAEQTCLRLLPPPTLHATVPTFCNVCVDSEERALATCDEGSWDAVWVFYIGGSQRVCVWGGGARQWNGRVGVSHRGGVPHDTTYLQKNGLSGSIQDRPPVRAHGQQQASSCAATRAPSPGRRHHMIVQHPSCCCW